MKSPWLQSHYFILFYFARMTFGVFGSACFLAYLWATYIVPETANVSLEMIDEVFRCPASQEDMVVKRQVRSPFYLVTIRRFF
jgi:hypothetical protein